MSTLDDVKKWMTFWGWSDGGNPGSAKRDDAGNVIAFHGDATWIKDVEEAADKSERLAIIAELERREVERA